ncbi:hypothetical protein [Streptomyces sp. NPDC051569]|uniref:hypothetical protein n=1 Tax=Streptomyces sp. NPDC051569 TaxID=3365661 RepID=UPI0037A4304B
MEPQLDEYDYQDEDVFMDREPGFYALWYRPEYTHLSIEWLESDKPLLTPRMRTSPAATPAARRI